MMNVQNDNGISSHKTLYKQENRTLALYLVLFAKSDEDQAQRSSLTECEDTVVKGFSVGEFDNYLE